MYRTKLLKRIQRYLSQIESIAQLRITSYNVCYTKLLRTLQQFRTIQLEYLLNFYQALAVGEDFFTDYINLLAGTKSFRRQVVAGWTAEQIRASWKEGLEGYKKIRANYLLYPDFKE